MTGILVTNPRSTNKGLIHTFHQFWHFHRKLEYLVSKPSHGTDLVNFYVCCVFV